MPSPRKSLRDTFPNLDIASQAASSSSTRKFLFLRGAFSKGWPSASLHRHISDAAVPGMHLKLTLQMSQDYRIYGDNWCIDPTASESCSPAQLQPLSQTFQFSRQIMSEIQELLEKHDKFSEDIENQLLEDMALAVFGANARARIGLNFEETMRICMLIFQGATGVEYSDRTEEYQARLDKFVRSGSGSNPAAVIRSRREVVQHAVAFQFIVDQFVKQCKPMSENLIKETHRILTFGLSAAEAGNISNQSFGGVYRSGNELAFAGSLEYTRPAYIPKAMRATVESLQNDIAAIENTGVIDPFMLAAKYSDRFVNIHPFKDGNGRMCRLILNTILIKYAGIVISLGEKDDERDEYLLIAQESTLSGGHAGQLGKKVLDHAHQTLRGLKEKLLHRLDQRVEKDCQERSQANEQSWF